MRRRVDRDRALVDCSDLIKFLSVETWKRLPNSQRAIIDVEDLIQEGRMYVWESVIPSWDARKGQKLSTWIYGCLKQHFINLTYSYYADKRKKKPVPGNGYTEIEPIWESAELYKKFFTSCSPDLQGLLISAVGTPKELNIKVKARQRYRTRGRRWNKNRKEFKELRVELKSSGIVLTLDDLELLQKKGLDYLRQ